jgi:hypothetical protein
MILKLIIAGAAIGGAIGIYFYFRPPQIGPISRAALDRYAYLEGLEGDPL